MFRPVSLLAPKNLMRIIVTLALLCFWIASVSLLNQMVLAEDKADVYRREADARRWTEQRFYAHLNETQRNQCRQRCGCVFKAAADVITCAGTTSPKLAVRSNLLCAENMRNIADLVIGWKEKQKHFNESIDFPVIDGNVTQCLPHGAIVFVVGTWSNLKYFFDQVYPQMKPFVLVTSETTESAPHDGFMRFVDDPDSKIIKWFAKNARLDKLSAIGKQRVEALPIGHNCFFNGRGVALLKKQLMVEPYALQNGANQYHALYDPRRILAPPSMNRKKLVLMNFDPETDPTGQRQYVIQRCNASRADNWLAFTDCISKKPGVSPPAELAARLRESLEYPFWLSPRGMGLDCHRTWEAVELGRIPIVLTSELDDLYSDLPILIVKSWDEISEEFLRIKYVEIEQKRQAGAYRFELTTFEYWRDLVLAFSAYASIDDPLMRPGRCWRPIEPSNNATTITVSA